MNTADNCSNVVVHNASRLQLQMSVVNRQFHQWSSDDFDDKAAPKSYIRLEARFVVMLYNFGTAKDQVNRIDFLMLKDNLVQMLQ